MRSCCCSSLSAASIAVLQLSSALSSISSGSFAAVNTAADARIDANNAKSNESLTLIARGSGQAFEDAWKSSADSVAGNLQRLTDQPELVRPMAGLHRRPRPDPRAR